MTAQYKPSSTKTSDIAHVLAATALYFNVLVLLLISIGMDEYIFGEASWTLSRYTIGHLCAMLGVIPILVRRSKYTTPSSLFIIFQLVFVHIPACALISVQQMLPVWFVITMTAYMMLFGLFMGPAVTLISSKSIRLPVSARLSAGLLVAAWLSFGLVVFLNAIASGKFNFLSAFDLDVLYSFRAEVFTGFSGAGLTALSALGYFLFPTLFIYSVYRSCLTCTIAVMSLVLLLYGITAMKTYLVICIFSGIIYHLAIRRRPAQFLTSFIGMLLAALLLAYVVGYFLESPWPLALAFNRGVMTPGQLHLVYAQYFVDKTHVPFWEVFGALPSDSGGLNVAQRIASDVYGSSVDSGEGANTGIFASAFAVYGYTGLVVHAIFISFILAVLDASLKMRVSDWAAYSAIPAIFLLTNVDLVSVTLYYGLGFSIVFLLVTKIRIRLTKTYRNVHPGQQSEIIASH